MKQHISDYRIEYIGLTIILILAAMLVVSLFAYADYKTKLNCDEAMKYRPVPGRCERQ